MTAGTTGPERSVGSGGVTGSLPAGAPAGGSGDSGEGRTITVRVRRSARGRPEGGAGSRAGLRAGVGPEGGEATEHTEQRYRVWAFPRMSVLDALFAIQREQDRSLSFRYSCRLGMCGTCAMVIDGREGLACQTLVEHLPGDEVDLRPLGHLPVLKDLVVDLEPFFDRYRAVKPHFVPRGDRAPGEAPAAPQVIKQGEGERRWVDPALGCITCGICHSACSVVGLNERFPGPAAFNRAFTLTNDVRDGARDERLALAGDADGVWRCHQLFSCASACPRHLVPTQAIRELRLDAGGRMDSPLTAPLRWLRRRMLPVVEPVVEPAAEGPAGGADAAQER